jgi:hypothetical protein
LHLPNGRRFAFTCINSSQCITTDVHPVEEYKDLSQEILLSTISSSGDETIDVFSMMMEPVLSCTGRMAGCFFRTYAIVTPSFHFSNGSAVELGILDMDASSEKRHDESNTNDDDDDDCSVRHASWLDSGPKFGNFADIVTTWDTAAIPLHTYSEKRYLLLAGSIKGASTNMVEQTVHYDRWALFPGRHWFFVWDSGTSDETW